MRQSTTILTVATRGKGLVDITEEVRRFVAAQDVRHGLLTIFCRHTSASLVIQENADPAVRRDILRYFETIAPESGAYEHDDEGPDDMPAHLRAALTQTHLSIPVLDGRPALGVWQAVYLFEHRKRPHTREIALHLIGA
jgi:secondary thiamine-phosphate synthase enzyme